MSAWDALAALWPWAVVAAALLVTLAALAVLVWILVMVVRAILTAEKQEVDRDGSA